MTINVQSADRKKELTIDVHDSRVAEILELINGIMVLAKIEGIEVDEEINNHTKYNEYCVDLYGGSGFSHIRLGLNKHKKKEKEETYTVRYLEVRDTSFFSKPVNKKELEEQFIYVMQQRDIMFSYDLDGMIKILNMLKELI